MKKISKYKINYNILAENLVHLGYPEKDRHHTNNHHIVTTDQKIDLINLIQSLKALRKILYLISNIVSKKGKVLIYLEDSLLAKRQTKTNHLLKQIIVYEKWPHGLLSNFKRLGKRLNKFQIKRIPNLAVYAVTKKKMETSINTEVKKLKIPHGAIIDTPLIATTGMYMVPGCTGSYRSIRFYNNLMLKAIIAGYQKEILFFHKKRKKNLKTKKKRSS